jgi:hypothetical protein
MDTTHTTNKEDTTMKVRDLQGEKYQLVTNSQDIEAISVDLGINPESFGCMFVEVINGEYGEVYGCYSNIPYLHYDVEKVH